MFWHIPPPTLFSQHYIYIPPPYINLLSTFIILQTFSHSGRVVRSPGRHGQGPLSARKLAELLAGSETASLDSLQAGRTAMQLAMVVQLGLSCGKYKFKIPASPQTGPGKACSSARQWAPGRRSGELAGVFNGDTCSLITLKPLQHNYN